ncbi:MAG: LacI family DNA-binding transcriptional regulator [Bacteroidales bacterium]|nr:LacI family DNA-binding transcriptional regulator [Bacteroidales bacterium]
MEYKKKRRVTLKDIANQLGVSHTTVSRALRNHPDISSERKEEIRKLAQKMHYNPNAFALSLRNSYSKIIGLIIPEITLYAFPSMIRGVSEFCYNAGYNVLILSSNESYEREKQNTDLLLSGQVDGLLVAITKETTDYQHFKQLEEEGIPVVFFDRVFENYGNTKVVIDDTRAAYTATEHLIESGRKKLAYFGGNESLYITQQRLKGFRKALKDYKMEEHTVVFADDSRESRRKVLDLFSKPDHADGIMCISDEVLSGIIPALQELEIDIPEQVGVISFSDGPIALMYKPTISIIHHSLARVGQVAVDLLIQRIEHPEDSHQQIHIIDTKLIPRGSTASVSAQ